MSGPTYRFEAREDLPDLGIVKGECLLITPSDRENPLVAAHPIDITPTQFFDAVIAGTLAPVRSPHEGSDNPIYAIRNAMRWPWQETIAPEDDLQDEVLNKEEAVAVLHQAAMNVLPEAAGTVSEKQAELSASLLAPELSRLGYRLVGPKPTDHQQRTGLRLDVG